MTEKTKGSAGALIAILVNRDDNIYCLRLELVQALLAEGYQLLISCPDGPKVTLMEKRYGLRKGRDFIYDNPPLIRRETSIRNDAKLFFHYFRLLRHYKPSAILTYTAKPNIYAGIAAKHFHIPVISNVTGLGSVIKMKEIKRFLVFSLFRKAFRASDCVMFQNEDNLHLAFTHGFVKGRYHLISGSGVALNRFPVQEYPEGGNGISGEPIIFNYVGRMLREKGVDDYLTAAQRIKEKYPNAEFNLIGFIESTEEHYREELAELEHQGMIKYRGEQEDVLPWIRRSHAIIHPSTYGEGISNVLLESAACGRPIITTDNTGCRETVEDGISGYIYPGGDVEELIQRIETLINTPNTERAKMGLAGRKKVEAEFDREIVIKTYLQEIKKCVEKTD